MPFGSISVDKIENSDGFTLGGSGAAMKNRVINGSMVIDQRNAGANSLPTITTYSTVDRFVPNMGTGSKYSLQQSTIAPPGFSNSLKVVSTAATTVGADDYYSLQHRIEGYNISDFSWGTSNASTATLSFWVRSSLTGTFGGALRSGSASYWTYGFNYTISAADTWEQKVITIPGPTSGAASYPANNTEALSIWFGFGVGSNNTLSPGTWSNVNKLSATGSVNLVSTQGSTWYITGIQLEKGSVATSYDFRSYATELALCQRYYFRATQFSTYSPVGVGRAWSSTTGNAPFFLPVPMRGNQTITYSDLSHFDIVTIGSPTSIGNDGSGPNNVKIGWGKSSGVTSGTLYQFEFGNTTSGWLGFDAEI